MIWLSARASVRPLHAPRNRPKRQLLGNRAVVAVLVGLSAPVLVMALALGIELSSWTVTKLKLQRTADAAALAASLAYNRGSTAQAAANYGAYVAEINGALGAKTRTWATYTKTLSDNMIIIQMTSGVVNSNDVAFVATIQTAVPLLFASIVLPAKTETITAAATAGLPAAGSCTNGYRHATLAVPSVELLSTTITSNGRTARGHRAALRSWSAPLDRGQRQMS